MVQIGDEVVVMSAPGRFRVIAVDAAVVTLENAEGVRKTVLESSIRTLQKSPTSWTMAQLSPPRSTRLLAHLAVGALVVTGVHGWVPITGGSAPPQAVSTVQLAKGSQTRPYKAPEDRDSDDNPTKSYSPLPRMKAGVASSPTGYNPKRGKRFWSHYHGARPEKKAKPIEREK
jgi:hypothetical protein